MFATQVLPETLTDDYTEESDSEIIGCIIVENKKYELKKGETKIGRDSTMCSVVIENFTISKVHAVIESEGVDDTFIYDVGSTNQTKLGKKILKPHCRYKLDNDSKLTLGNVTAKFVIGPDKTSDDNSQTPRSGNFDPLNELGDIFDVPTQVNCVQTDASSKVSAYEKLPDNFQIFKIPHSVSAAKPSTSSKSSFKEDTQCRLDSDQTKQRTVYCPNSLENSGIFSLGTQCQLYEAPAEPEINCEVQTASGKNNKNSESDKIKSLLNDGQDDVLCCFMLLHSPEEQGGLVKEVITKTELKGLTQVLDAPTQTQVETVEERERRELNEILHNKDLSKDFSTISKPGVTSTPLSNKFIHPNSVPKKMNMSVVDEDLIQTQEFNCLEVINEANNRKPTVTSTPLNNKFIHPDSVSKNSSTSVVDEDLIQTQEFNCLEVINEANNRKPTVMSTPLSNKFVHPNSVSKNSSTGPVDEDLILTQQFNCLESGKETDQKDGGNLSEDEETQPYLDDTLNRSQQNEDLILTQTFEAIEKNLQTKQTPAVVPETEEMIVDKEDFLETQIFPAENEIRRGGQILPETPDRDLDASFTHRNDEDDFIATQVFEERTSARNENEKSDCDDKDDEEDFIATQKVEFPLSGTSNRRVAEATSRESSPDLLAPDSFSKTHEDCINTQLFEGPVCQSVTTATAQQISSHKEDCNVAEPDNSGDETESDLEILLDETTQNEGQDCPTVIKSEQPHPQTSQSDDSNSSYIFELEPENPTERAGEHNRPAELSDSDATDCEEIAVLNPKIRVKEEPKVKMECEETQVLTLTLADNFAEQTSTPRDDWMAGGAESPKFECESPLSLEMPNTQEIETTVNRIFPSENEDSRKTEVGITNGGVTLRVESPLKRPLDRSSGEVVPVKKSKTEVSDRNSEIQLSKLVQAHDIAQIQPSRTRNSLKSLAKENKNGVSLLGNNINERPTSRRRGNAKKGSTKNPNGDITPYLTKRVERKSSHGERRRDASPSEKEPVVGSSKRVLRSSSRNPAPANPPNTSTRKWKRRNSRTNEYFAGSCVNVVFTGFDCGILEKIISDLRGKKTNDLSSGDVVVADKVRRTVKFLCAIGLSLPIASPEWLLSCKREKKFLNPWDFILKDEESEEKWDFDLKASLEKSKKMKLLQGFSIFATKSTRPPVKDLLAIVEFCGGIPLFDHPDVWPKKTVIVSCLEDKKWWPPAKLRNVRVVHYEFILTGVLRQKIDFKTYELR